MVDTIQALTDEAIRGALREALDDPDPVQAACDFVQSVDWSGMAAVDAAVVRLLGELEQLTTDVSEGVISRTDFLDDIRRAAATIRKPALIPSTAATS